ncbi:hypothetical protein [Nannocystis pusilla]|uniref:hypothetical protein n=1 Tax=Nannocystis pusilla TaxID=889268 RepID=UPI003BF38479
MTTPARLALCALAATFTLSVATSARAADVKRRGGQAEMMIGGSLCIPSRTGCKSTDEIVGRTLPSFGMGFTLGFRPIRALMIGAAYNVGFFNADYQTATTDAYRASYQNSFFAVIRGILPIWRIDLGLEIGPGFSRQVFNARGGVLPYDRQFSQGFALKTAPSIDFFVTQRFFLGGKIDFIWNFHREVCTAEGGNRACFKRDDNDQASVHQMIVGFHLGTTF